MCKSWAGQRISSSRRCLVFKYFNNFHPIKAQKFLCVALLFAFYPFFVVFFTCFLLFSLASLSAAAAAAVKRYKMYPLDMSGILD